MVVFYGSYGLLGTHPTAATNGTLEVRNVI